MTPRETATTAYRIASLLILAWALAYVVSAVSTFAAAALSAIQSRPGSLGEMGAIRWKGGAAHNVQGVHAARCVAT